MDESEITTGNLAKLAVAIRPALPALPPHDRNNYQHQKEDDAHASDTY
jgi:hypothetical protein